MIESSAQSHSIRRGDEWRLLSPLLDQALDLDPENRRALIQSQDPEIADRCRVFHHFASGAQITRLDVDPDKGMAGRTVQGLIDVLEGNYGGDPTKMPYVVNKEAWA